MEPKHERRVRYKGTHPRSFREKYKELDPEKYGAEIAKHLQKGKTPAGMHIPICVEEILAFLDIQPGQVGLDATLGYGGHSQRMLEALQGQGHLYATDVDPVESEKTRLRLEKAGYGAELFTLRQMNFAQLDQVAPGVLFDFVLADLGVSSMQIDDPARGFTFREDGPLDLRLNQQAGVPAAQRLAGMGQEELAALLRENADEPYAAPLAKAIFHKVKRGGGIRTTKELAQVVEQALDFLPPKERKEGVRKACQRVFQALRIDVNGEYEALYQFLEKLPGVLKPGGKAAILTFHSGEDRLVKKSFQALARAGVYEAVAREVIRPSLQEQGRNPRARSAKLRWAVRSQDPLQA